MQVYCYSYVNSVVPVFSYMHNLFFNSVVYVNSYHFVMYRATFYKNFYNHNIIYLLTIYKETDLPPVKNNCCLIKTLEL